MARFSDLTEQDRIQYIKDGFVLILEQLAKDPSKLVNYIKLDAPKLNVPAFEFISDSMDSAQKAAAEERNKLLSAKVEVENEKLLKDFATKAAAFKKIEEIVSKIQKKEGCLCGSCININITNNVVPQELEPLIDIARKEAEERTY